MDELLLVPRDACLPYYLSWFTDRNLPEPAIGSLSIFVASKSWGPIVGVGVHVTDGPYFFLEGLASNPKAPARLVHRAVLVMAEQAKAMGAAMCKHPLLLTAKPSLARTLLRAGFQIHDSVPMWAPPIAAIREAKKDGARAPRPVRRRKNARRKAQGPHG